MKIKRCSPSDVKDVLRIFSDDSVFPWITDDGTMNKEALEKDILGALHNVRVYFLMPRVNTVIMLIPTNTIMYDVHVAAIEGGGRKHAADDAYNCLVWMIEKTKARKFTTMIPGYNRSAVFFARRCGMKKEGTLKEAYLKDDKLWGIEMYGATDKEVLNKRS